MIQHAVDRYSEEEGEEKEDGEDGEDADADADAGSSANISLCFTKRRRIGITLEASS